MLFLKKNFREIAKVGILQKILNVVCREPYRLFFPVGIWMGVVGISPWLLYVLGLTDTYSGMFHSSMQMLVYMNCFVIGFLMTFIPRFTGTFYASRAEVFSFLFLFFGMALFLRIEHWEAAQILYLVWLFLLVTFLIRRIRGRQRTGGNPPLELVWIPIAILHAFVGTMVYLLAEWQVVPNWMLKTGRSMMEQGFLLSVVLGIGGFLIPRILGISKTESLSGGGCESCASATKKMSATLKSILFHLGCGLALFASFWVEGLGFIRWAYLIKAVVAILQFSSARILFGLPAEIGFYAKIAWFSCRMVVSGFIMAAVFPKYSIEMLHITFIGGFSLMTFAIATMVVLSHAGQAEELKKPLWILWLIVAALGFSLIERVLVIFSPDAFFRILAAASAAWIFGAVAWLFFVLPKLFCIPNEDEFVKMHEEAKARVSRM